MSLSSLPKQFLTERNREYIWLTTYSYIKLKQSVIENDFQTLLNDFNEKQLRPYTKKNEINGSITLQLQPVSDIHLDNTFRFDFPGAVNPTYLKIFSSVAFLTLLIALINYVNLTTAKVSKRLKEIGIKKCMGATKRTLFLHFVFETLITVYVCYLFSLLLLYFALPTLNGLTSKTFSFVEILNARFLVYSHLFVIVFAFAASIYPALLLSSFKPVHAIRAAKSIAGTTMIEKLLNPAFIRKSLVVVQFSISIFLIIGTIIIYQQFDFVNSYQLGFDREQIMVIDIPTDTAVSNQIEVVKNKLRELSVVKDVSSSSSIPGGLHGSITMNVSQSGGSEIKVVNIYFVDDKFLDALNLELKEGRFFSKEYATDPQEAFVVNEAAAKFLGWTNPLNMKLESPFGQKGTVVGVVKDFNYKSLHSLIEPLILMNSKTTQGFLLVKLDTKNLAQAVASVSEVWTQFDNAHPYEYFFLDQKFQEQYTKEQNLLRIFTYFSSFAILISCLGLIGLAIFTNEVKVKEIGIRKSLGATDLQIFSLLSRGFLILILLANIIAWPASYWLVNNWLNEFAYKTDINVYPFVLGALIAFAIAFLTIGFFANRAAKGNIIEALKYE
jgi:putative ABC transport system permease protein